MKAGWEMLNNRYLAVFILGAVSMAAGAAEPPQDGERGAASHLPAGFATVGVLRVAAEYDDREFRIHYEFPTDEPSWYHQYWVYKDGAWVRHGQGASGPDPHGLYEDRISMLLDDGAVEGFDRYGGWMTAHEGMRTLDSAAATEEVKAHPKLGADMGRRDVRKYLPQSREVADPAEISWSALKDDAALERLREDGVFLDLWQWRAHRSHPVGYADNGYVAHYRLSSEGRSMFTDNWDDEADRPAYMFDPKVTDRVALRWDELVAGEYGQDDPYFISEDNAVAFDPEHKWQDGDVLPQRFLRQPDGSRGAIRASGGYSDGAWRITLSRSLETPNPKDSKSLAEGEIYNVAFAVHAGAVGARWHLVSLPQKLGLGRDDADIRARRVKAPLDDEELDWVEIPLTYPGQVTWQWLNSDHSGSRMVRAGKQGVRDFHNLEQLKAFILEHERELIGNGGSK